MTEELNSRTRSKERKEKIKEIEKTLKKKKRQLRIVYSITDCLLYYKNKRFLRHCIKIEPDDDIALEDILWKYELFSRDNKDRDNKNKEILRNDLISYSVALEIEVVKQKAEVTDERISYYKDRLSYYHSENPGLFYGIFSVVLTILGFCILAFKILPHAFYILDYAESSDFLIGGLLNINFWISIAMFLVAYGLIPSVLLQRYHTKTSGKNTFFPINWLYSMHKKPGFFIVFSVIFLLPSTITSPWLTVKNIFGDGSPSINVVISKPQRCLTDLTPIHRLKKYYVFSKTTENMKTEMAIPVSNISAIFKDSKSHGGNRASDNSTDQDTLLCNGKKEVKTSSILLPEILLASLTKSNDMYMRKFEQVSSKTITLLDRMNVNFAIKSEPDLTYLHNYLTQDMNKKFNIIKEYPAIYFKHDLSELNDTAKAAIDKIIKRSAFEDPSVCLLIVGYANTQGTDSFNEDLSKKRANAVKNYILEESNNTGIRVEATWVGEKNYDYQQSLEGPTNRRARIFVVEYQDMDITLEASLK